MNRTRLVGGLVALALAAALGACSTRGGMDGGAAGRAGAGAGYGDAAGGRHGARAAGYGQDAAGVAPRPSQTVILFGYDSDDVLPQYQPVVAAHADYLASHPGESAVLEGHADERGSPEYNVALGERRARSVLKSLRLQGAGDEQLRLLSYGEEKPAVAGHDESAWQQNRRVEIVYTGP